MAICSKSSLLALSAAGSAPSGSSSGPAADHQAWVHAYTPSAVEAIVEMSSAVCPGVRSVAEDHVRHVGRALAARGEGGEQGAAVGDHTRIDDDHHVAVDDQRHGPAHPLVVAAESDVALVQHVHPGGAARWDVGCRDAEFSHGTDHTPG